jgi:hypothetical protein
VASWGHRVDRLADEKLALAVDLGETCGTRNCSKSPAWVTAYDYVSGRAGNTSQRRQRVCAEHAAQFAGKHGLVLPREARRTADGDCSDEPEAGR